jgi:predicted RNA binding protein YcfA (HicA-like mRNA interferase family)
MGKIEKLLASLRFNPSNRRYAEFERIVRAFGGEIRAGKGSHFMVVFRDGQRIVFVKPHPSTKAVHPRTIKTLLMAIEEMEEEE